MKRSIRIFKKIVNSPPSQTGRNIGEKIKKAIYHARNRYRQVGLTEKEFLQAFGSRFPSVVELTAYWQARPPRPFYIHPKQREETLAILRNHFPQAEKRILNAATRSCEHIFDLLGVKDFHAGEKIDWHRDFGSTYRFDPQQYFANIRPAPYPGGYDIKLPWEISRCQHFVWLGQAYWLSEDERFAEEFVQEVQDWIEQNPVRRGVNWSCTMDVAIRAVNWLWGYAFCESSICVDHPFLLVFLKSMLEHGRHIYTNLEKSESGSSNHYLSNLVGLAYLGCLLPEFHEATIWREFAFTEMEREMILQVYPDGVDYEASISYHRLVTELFLFGMLLGQDNGWTFSQIYMDRLEKMLEYVLYLTRPDGTVPLIGDHDNGRLLRLKVWNEEEADREWTDFRYLLAIGAVLFERRDFTAGAGDQWEEALWIFGKEAVPYLSDGQAKPVPELNSRQFSGSGIIVMRQDDLHLVFDGGKNGLNGLGAHAHNDTLSFDLFASARNWMPDSGSGTYTRDYNVRNQFRSVRAHNALMVDDYEPNQLRADDPFRLGETVVPRIEKWVSNEKFDILVASQRGISQSDDAIIHRRMIYFHKIQRYWIIRDILDGKGEHLVEWFFQAGDNPVRALNMPGLGVCFGNERVGLVLIPIQPVTDLGLDFEDASLSKAYGEWKKSTRIVYRQTGRFPLEAKYFISTDISEMTLAGLQDAAAQAWQSFGLFGFS